MEKGQIEQQPPTLKDEIRKLRVRPIPFRTSRQKLESPETSAYRRHLGLGRLLLSAEIAQQSIAQLDASVERLLAVDPSSNLREVIRLLKLKKGFNRLLLEIGVAQIRAATKPADGGGLWSASILGEDAHPIASSYALTGPSLLCNP